MVGSYIPPNPCCLASLVASTASSMEVYSFPASWWPGMKTALLLRTEMSILKVDKMSPLFQEEVVASSVAQLKQVKLRLTMTSRAAKRKRTSG